MKSSKPNRRQFLGAAAAGASVAGLALATSSLIPRQASAGRSLPAQANSLEHWLLATGQDDLPPELLTLATQQLQES